MENVQQNIDVWDKWSYDTENECFVFFTLASEWEDDDHFYCYYKAKAWINNRKFSDFLEVFKIEENQRTYTSKNESYTIQCEIAKGMER